VAQAPDFHASRLKGIGGSDAAPACGLSRYKSRYRLWCEKTGLLPEVEPTSESILWGTLLEDVVAQEYSRRTGLDVRRCNRQLRSVAYPWMVGHIDRDIVGMRGILEVKCTSRAVGTPIPIEHYCQVQHYMVVADADFADLATLHGGNRLVIHRIVRDAAFVTPMLELEAELWHCVVTETPPSPMPDLDEATARMEAHRDAGADAEEVDLPCEVDTMIDRYVQACAAEKEAAIDKLRWKNAISHALGAAGKGYTPLGRTVRYTVPDAKGRSRLLIQGAGGTEDE
jgi:putative phage-type endonuclease